MPVGPEVTAILPLPEGCPFVIFLATDAAANIMVATSLWPAPRYP